MDPLVQELVHRLVDQHRRWLRYHGSRWMAMTDPASELDFYDPGFLADPYPALCRVREATPIFRNQQTGQWMLTRFADVDETLRDRRLGRIYHHRFRHAELGRPEPDPRWASFHQHERWSLLSLEPPDHTRIRKLVSKVFTLPFGHPRSHPSSPGSPGSSSTAAGRWARSTCSPTTAQLLLGGGGCRGVGRAAGRHAAPCWTGPTPSSRCTRCPRPTRSRRRADAGGRRVHRLHAGSSSTPSGAAHRTIAWSSKLVQVSDGW